MFGNHKDGLSRTDIAGQIGEDVLATIGVKRDELADKLRQPLGELVDDNKIHTIGEKRLMRYHAGRRSSRNPRPATAPWSFYFLAHRKCATLESKMPIPRAPR